MIKSVIFIIEVIKTKRKVAIYTRVSTEREAQISALGNQIQYYDEILKSHPDWQLIARYIDEGIKIDEKLEEKIKKRIKILNDLVETENAKLDKVLDLYLINQVSTSIYK